MNSAELVLQAVNAVCNTAQIIALAYIGAIVSRRANQ